MADTQLAHFVTDVPAATTKGGYKGLASAEGIPAGDVPASNAGTGSMAALRWSYVVAGLLTMLFGASSFIVILAVAKPVNATIYTWLMQGGFLSSVYNVGLAAGIAFTAIGLIEFLVAVIPAGFALIEQAISVKGVNGFRTTLDIAYDIPIYWLLLQQVFMRDVFTLIFAILYILAKNYMLHVAMDMNNQYILRMMGLGSKGKSTYYTALVAAGISTLFTWLLAGAFVIDSLIYSTQTIVKTAYTVIVIISAIWLFLTDFWRVIDYGVRYARYDTGCFQQVATGDTVHCWLTFIRCALLITLIYLGSFCGPLGTGTCLYLNFGVTPPV